MICVESGRDVLSIVAEENWHLLKMCGGVHLVNQPLPYNHCLIFLCLSMKFEQHVT